VNGETVSGCEAEPTERPPTALRAPAPQTPSAISGLERAIHDRVPRSSVDPSRGVLIQFPTYCLNVSGYQIRADMPRGVPAYDTTTDIDSQRIWYRSVLYKGADAISSSEWFYTDVREQTAPVSTDVWVRYSTGEAGSWYWTYNIDTSGTWSVRAELWWWQDGLGWVVDRDGFALTPVHRDFDGVWRNNYCSAPLNTAFVYAGGPFGFNSDLLINSFRF
jgi:hypothetical protein